ncbi:hypothetical protein B0J12DRAFT_710478 [Macrophomina phaseolina]|uniref:Zn(2)-C6 fungal-type domain-containing protein n=1 Tax=Macrophomina phaseolina TaxID=35725 RepID=A0ABQ8GG52_9PEZI|nr:hypothetical protein B0J12DRAFT_710478 [Macrophomina phaseolina]
MSAAGPTPEQRTPLTSAPKPQRVLACVLCQQRKIKCNRKFPCANCIRLRASCVPAALNPRRRKRRFPERELLDRLRKYEDLLREHNVKFEPLHQYPVAEGSPPSVRGTSNSDDVVPEIAGFRNPENDSDSLQDDILEGVVRSSWDSLYTNKDHLLLDSRRTPIYLDNVNPLFKVTHAPNLQGRIVEAASNVSRTSAVLEALMFSIYCVSVQSLVEDDCRAIFSSSKEDLLTASHFGCEQALLNCGFLRTGDRDCLTALLLYLPANARCTALEAEMRRRLWWALVLFDSRVGELADCRSAALAPTWDCSIPLNVNDADLWPEMREPAAVLGKCTEALFAAVRSELGEFLRHNAVHLDFTVPALKAISKEPQEEDGLDGLERMINDKYLRFCDPENSFHFMTIWTTRLFLARYRLVEHYSRNTGASIQQTETRRNAALPYALDMLDCDTKGYRWLFNFYFPFPAYVHFVQELKRRPVGEHAERAWEMTSAHYDSRFSFSPATTDENSLSELFAGFVLQAWEPREAALQESGRPLTPPRIVSCFRNHIAQMTCNAQQEADTEQQRNPATGQGTYAGTGMGGFPDPSLPVRFPVDLSVNQLSWAAIDWSFGDRRGG